MSSSSGSKRGRRTTGNLPITEVQVATVIRQIDAGETPIEIVGELFVTRSDATDAEIREAIPSLTVAGIAILRQYCGTAGFTTASEFAETIRTLVPGDLNGTGVEVVNLPSSRKIVSIPGESRVVNDDEPLPKRRSVSPEPSVRNGTPMDVSVVPDSPANNDRDMRTVEHESEFCRYDGRAISDTVGSTAVVPVAPTSYQLMTVGARDLFNGHGMFPVSKENVDVVWSHYVRAQSASSVPIYVSDLARMKICASIPRGYGTQSEICSSNLGLTDATGTPTSFVRGFLGRVWTPMLRFSEFKVFGLADSAYPVDSVERVKQLTTCEAPAELVEFTKDIVRNACASMLGAIAQSCGKGDVVDKGILSTRIKCKVYGDLKGATRYMNLTRDPAIIAAEMIQEVVQSLSDLDRHVGNAKDAVKQAPAGGEAFHQAIGKLKECETALANFNVGKLPGIVEKYVEKMLPYVGSPLFQRDDGTHTVSFEFHPFYVNRKDVDESSADGPVVCMWDNVDVGRYGPALLPTYNKFKVPYDAARKEYEKTDNTGRVYKSFARCRVVPTMYLHVDSESKKMELRPLIMPSVDIPRGTRVSVSFTPEILWNNALAKGSAINLTYKIHAIAILQAPAPDMGVGICRTVEIPDDLFD